MGVASCLVVSELVMESFLTFSPLWSYTYTGSAGPVRTMCVVYNKNSAVMYYSVLLTVKLPYVRNETLIRLMRSVNEQD